MDDHFREYHPVANILFYAGVLGITMFFMNLVFMIISFLGAAAYILLCFNKKKLIRSMAASAPVVILSAVLNPLLNHEGATILGYFRTGNPLTLEAFIFGLTSGLMMSTTILWSATFNDVITTDKLTYLFGKILPAFSLLLSVSLAFIPKLLHQYRLALDGQRGLFGGGEQRKYSKKEKLRRGAGLFSILVTWSLENSIETADSMAARGLGLRGRTQYSIFHFGRKDGALIFFISVCLAVTAFSIGSRSIFTYYYPTFAMNKTTPGAIAAYMIYALFSWCPVWISLLEELKWKYYLWRM